MKQLIITYFIYLSLSCANTQKNEIDQTKIREDLNVILITITQNYIYLEEKNVDLNCIRKYYKRQIRSIGTKEQLVLFFEYLLDEFYDSHLILNTNRNSSFRLYSPIYVTIKNGKTIVSNVW